MVLPEIVRPRFYRTTLHCHLLLFLSVYHANHEVVFLHWVLDLPSCLGPLRCASSRAFVGSPPAYCCCCCCCYDAMVVVAAAAPGSRVMGERRNHTDRRFHIYTIFYGLTVSDTSFSTARLFQIHHFLWIRILRGWLRHRGSALVIVFSSSRPLVVASIPCFSPSVILVSVQMN